MHLAYFVRASCQLIIKFLPLEEIWGNLEDIYLAVFEVKILGKSSKPLSIVLPLKCMKHERLHLSIAFQRYITRLCDKKLQPLNYSRSGLKAET